MTRNVAQDLSHKLAETMNCKVQSKAVEGKLSPTDLAMLENGASRGSVLWNALVRAMLGALNNAEKDIELKHETDMKREARGPLAKLNAALFRSKKRAHANVEEDAPNVKRVRFSENPSRHQTPTKPQQPSGGEGHDSEAPKGPGSFGR